MFMWLATHSLLMGFCFFSLNERKSNVTSFHKRTEISKSTQPGGFLDSLFESTGKDLAFCKMKWTL